MDEGTGLRERRTVAGAEKFLLRLAETDRAPLVRACLNHSAVDARTRMDEEALHRPAPASCVWCGELQLSAHLETSNRRHLGPERYLGSSTLAEGTFDATSGARSSDEAEGSGGEGFQKGATFHAANVATPPPLR